jgi:hypothetical protein
VFLEVDELLGLDRGERDVDPETIEENGDGTRPGLTRVTPSPEGHDGPRSTQNGSVDSTNGIHPRKAIEEGTYYVSRITYHEAAFGRRITYHEAAFGRRIK